MHKLKEKIAIESIKWIKKDISTIILKSELDEEKAIKEKISSKLINKSSIIVNNKKPFLKLFSLEDFSSHKTILNQKINIPKKSEIILIIKKDICKSSL